MENLFYNISQVLGITIIHSLWQGLIVYMVLRLFMLAFPATSSAVKYRVSYGAFIFILGWFIYTLFKELGHYNWLSTTALQISPLALPAILHEVSEPANRYYITIARYMPYLTMVYVVGLVFNTLKLSLAWNSIYRIRQNISDAGFETAVKRLSAQLGLKKQVKAAFSQWVDVPCITGFIKPIILLPLSITCYLSTEEIEAILLHELAHIKRNDYLFNFIQQVIGILLFFNPFARLVNKLINEERENCCDDIVVRVTGSPFLYAQALLKLEENKQQQWQLALAATGKKYELLNRIERIMKTKNNTVNIRPVLITVLALTCSISSIAWLNPEIKNGKVIIKNAPAIKMISAAITASAAPAPAPKPVAPKHKRNLSIKYYTDSANTAALKDTSIKNKKYKIVLEDENGTKKEYNSVSELSPEDRADFYRNVAGINYKRAMPDSQIAAIKKFYKSDKWKQQQKQIEKNATLIAKQFNSPEWKQKQKDMVEKSMAMAKKFNGPEWKKQQEQIEKNAALIAKQFNSPEWKKQQEEYAKMGADAANSFINSPEWKTTQDAIVKQAMDMAKQFNTPEWKATQEVIVKQAMDMAKQFDTPEWKARQEVIVKQAMDIAKQFNNPEWKENKEEIKKQAKELRKSAKEMTKSLKNSERIKELKDTKEVEVPEPSTIEKETPRPIAAPVTEKAPL